MDFRGCTSIYEDGEDQLEKLIYELSEDAREKETENKDEPEPEFDRCLYFGQIRKSMP